MEFGPVFIDNSVLEEEITKNLYYLEKGYKATGKVLVFKKKKT
jgi:polysaccharide deacetylase 2 family uncharacterized protein YibQ